MTRSEIKAALLANVQGKVAAKDYGFIEMADSAFSDYLVLRGKEMGVEIKLPDMEQTAVRELAQHLLGKAADAEIAYLNARDSRPDYAGHIVSQSEKGLLLIARGALETFAGALFANNRAKKAATR